MMNQTKSKPGYLNYLPLYLLVFFVFIALLLVYLKPSAHQHARPPAPPISVKTLRVEPKAYQVMVDSFGRVEPRTQGHLIAQVSGQVTEVSPNFSDGGFFAKGEVLVKIDPRDYEVQVDIAAADLADAKVNYAEQQLLAEQAVNDRKTIPNRSKIYNDFALYIPQLAAAKSKVDAAEAKLKQAKLDVERTQIRAPYSGRILTKSVDIGEVISANTDLASIYAIDCVEVRLPVKNSELPLMDIPEYAHGTDTAGDALPKARIINALGDTPQSWPALLVRTAGAIDEQSQQLSVTAQINQPYGEQNRDRRPLKIGQYVTAQLEGKTIKDAMVIPNAAIYQGSYVYLYQDGVLERREIDIAWQNSQEALLQQGVKPGEELVLTPLGRVSSGTAVQKLADAEQDHQKRRSRRNGKRRSLDGKRQWKHQR